jgi:GGDEF domain-containing protein
MDREFLADLADCLPDAVVVVDNDTVVWMNRAAVRLIGATVPELADTTALDLFHPDDRAAVAAAWRTSDDDPGALLDAQVGVGQGSSPVEMARTRLRDGSLALALRDLTRRPRPDGDLETVRSLVDAVDLVMADPSADENGIDILTNLAGRSLLLRRLAECLDDPRTAVISLDLDGFADVNDTFGHDIGDEVLRQLAGRLEQSVRRADLVARTGGDAFVVLARTERDEDLERLS